MDGLECNIVLTGGVLLECLSANDLKRECKKRNLYVSGNKATLRERLIKAAMQKYVKLWKEMSTSTSNTIHKPTHVSQPTQSLVSSDSGTEDVKDKTCTEPSIKSQTINSPSQHVASDMNETTQNSVVEMYQKDFEDSAIMIPQTIDDIKVVPGSPDIQKDGEFTTKPLLKIGSRVIPCAHRTARFMVQHYSGGSGLPISVHLRSIPQGLKVTGPPHDVSKAVQTLKSIQWKTEIFQLSSPKLSTYFSSVSWKAFVITLENGNRCMVSVKMKIDMKKTSEGDDDMLPTPSKRSRSSTKAAKNSLYGDLKVTVCQGDIVEDTSEVIVNGVLDSSFKLSKGALSSAICKKSGSLMQDECSNSSSNTHDIRVTCGWNLNCKVVLHVVTPRQMIQVTPTIKSALECVEKLKANSVAFPMLGAGGFGLNLAKVSRSMLKAFREFAADRPKFVKEIKVIVLDGRNVSTVKKIIKPGKAKINDNEDKRNSEENLLKSKYGNLNIEVSNGNIIFDDSEVIVNGVCGDFDLSQGALSSAVLEEAGNEMQDQCQNSPKVKTDELRVTDSFNLLCKHVIHVVIPYRPFTPCWSDGFTERIFNVLTQADALQAESVAIPTLGAGGNGLCPFDVATCMSQAFQKFSASCTFVKRIRLVVYDWGILPVFKATILTGAQTLGKRQAASSKAKAASVNIENVTIEVRSDRTAEVNVAKVKINIHMNKQIVKNTISDKFFANLDDHDSIEIYEASVKYSVQIKLGPQFCELRGLRDDVDKMFSHVQEILKDLKEASFLSKTCLWKWSDSSRNQPQNDTNLPPRVSYALEQNYQKQQRGKCSVRLFNNHLFVDFSTMMFDYQLTSGNLKRIDNNLYGIPAEWDDMEGRSWIKVELDHLSEEYRLVKDKFKKSQPKHGHIDKIERMQNPDLYKMYMAKKHSVQKHMESSCNPVERELFHGTTHQDIDRICDLGFDRGFAGKNGSSLGKGCYFSVFSKYALSFATMNTARIKSVFMALVLTGDFTEGNSTMTVSPAKNTERDCHKVYDSVVDNQRKPSMFAVFNDSSVYPQYLVSFKCKRYQTLF